MRKSKIPAPRVHFAIRHLHEPLLHQIKALILATGHTKEEIANMALKLGLKALRREVARKSKELPT